MKPEMRMPGFTAAATIYDSVETYSTETLSRNYRNGFVIPSYDPSARWIACVRCLQSPHPGCGPHQTDCILRGCRHACRPVLSDEP